MSTSSFTCNEEIRPANFAGEEPVSRTQEFVAINEFVREHFKQWVTVAQMCLRVKAVELWREGKFHSWDEWVNSFGEKSARTLYYWTGTFASLSSDFTPSEIAAMPPETAKALRGLPSSVRRSAVVREASRGKRKALIATVKANFPDQHFEDSSIYGISLSETQREIVETEFEVWRKDDENISDGEILVALCIASSEIRKGGKSV